MRERKRDRVCEGGTKRKRERETKKERIVCVCKRERIMSKRELGENRDMGGAGELEQVFSSNRQHRFASKKTFVNF